MNIQLIQDEFDSNDALELIAQIVHLKIKYHEHKMNSRSNEEEIKTREAKINQLQKELFELRKKVHSKTNRVKIEAIIKIEQA
jgi:Spy/CpxP family protein refolding chaperone